MGITTVKLVRNLKKTVSTGLSQFVLSSQILLLLIHKRTWSYKIIVFFHLCKINFKDYLDKHPNIHIFQTM